LSQFSGKQLLEQQLKSLSLSSTSRPTTEASWIELLQRIETLLEDCETARRAAEGKLRAGAAAMFNSSTAPNLVFDEGGILDCNSAAVQILGAASKEEILAHHPAHFSPEHQPDGRLSKDKSVEMDRLARQTGCHRFEWLHRKMDGTEFPVEVTLTPVIWGDKSALLVLWVDLSEKKMRELQVIHSAKMASLGEMSASVAHEINNPLAVISLSLILLPKLKDNPAKFSDKIQAIQRSCGRIEKIVNGLRKFSRSDEHVDFAAKRLRDIVQESSNLVEVKAKSCDTPVTYELNSEAAILCSDIQIEQVLVNLIHNGIDATKELDERWVRVSLYDDRDCVVLHVRDSGPGIPAEVRSKLFQPFFTTKPAGEGTGLGLSIIKGILDGHHATISILTQEPNTCFEIRFRKTDLEVKVA
jgi:PAS domain S-box-containing protein